MGKRLWVERNKDGSWDAFGARIARISTSAKAAVSSRLAT